MTCPVAQAVTIETVMIITSVVIRTSHLITRSSAVRSEDGVLLDVSSFGKGTPSVACGARGVKRVHVAARI